MPGSRVSGSAVLALCVACLLLPSSRAVHDIVVLVADDIGVDTFDKICDRWSFESTDVEYPVDFAPNLRAYCETGVVFTQATSNPVCTPTRAAMLTGRHGYLTGVSAVAGGPVGIDESEHTVPQLLRRYAGYKTAHFGKWHLNKDGNDDTFPVSNKPGGRWYDYFSGTLNGTLSDFELWTKYISRRQGPNVISQVFEAHEAYATTDDVDMSIAWIGKQSESKPLFVWHGFNAPHTPFHRPPDELLFSDAFLALSGTTEDIATQPKMYYLAAIQALDQELGRLVTAMHALRPDTEKTFVFVGDNGPDREVVDNTILRARKSSLYQGGVHVPMLVWGDSVDMNAGGSVNDPVGVVDLFSTMVEMGGVDLSAAAASGELLDGVTINSQSLLGFVNSQFESTHDGTAFAEHYLDGSDADEAEAARNQNFKLIRSLDGTGTEQLFHIATKSYEHPDMLRDGVENLRTHALAAYHELSAILDTADAARTW